MSILLAGSMSCKCGDKTQPAGNAGNNVAQPDWVTNPDKYAGRVKDNRAENDTLVICVGNQYSSIDPQKIIQSWAMPYAMLLFEGLINLDEKGENVLPGVAKTWEVSEDGKTWTFHLRDNSNWVGPDGKIISQVTSQDFKFAWGRCLDADFVCEYRQMFRDTQFLGVAAYMDKLDAAAKNPNNKKLAAEAEAMYDKIIAETIQTPDEKTLVVKLESASRIFLRQMAFSVFFPVNKTTVDTWRDAWTQPEHIVGNGSFRLTFFDKDRVEFDRNPHYWWKNPAVTSAAGREVKRIIGYTPNNVGAVYDEYVLGNVDWMGIGCTLPPKFVSRNMDESGRPLLLLKDFYITQGGRSIYIVVNSQRDMFNDPRVRQALGFAIDRDTIIRKVLKAPHTAAGTMTPAGLGGYDAGFSGFTYDLPRAKQLLAAAGFPGGNSFPSFTYIFRKDGVGPIVAVELQKSWAALGLQVELQPLEPKVLTNRHLEGNFEVAAAGWGMDYPDAYTFLGMYRSDSPYNFVKWRDPEYDRLSWEGFTTPDATRRFELYRQCEQKLFADASYIPLLWFSIAELIKPTVGGLMPNGADDHNLRYVYFKKGEGG